MSDKLVLKKQGFEILDETGMVLVERVGKICYVSEEKIQCNAGKTIKSCITAKSCNKCPQHSSYKTSNG